MVLETHVKLCMREPDFPEKFLPQKYGKWTKNGPKTKWAKKWAKMFFFNLLENCH